VSSAFLDQSGTQTVRQILAAIAAAVLGLRTDGNCPSCQIQARQTEPLLTAAPLFVGE